MPDGRKRILGPFTGRKKRKAWNKTRVKYMPVKRRQNLAETDKGSYYKEEWLEEFLDSKGAFYNGNESDINDEREAVTQRCSVKKFSQKSCKIHRKTPVPESLFQ